MRRLTISVDDDLADTFDRLVKEKGYGNRSEAFRDLVGCATIAVWNTEQVLHLARVEVGDTPGADLFRGAQLFECRHDAGEFGSRNW